jgi:hypothetical protein
MSLIDVGIPDANIPPWFRRPENAFIDDGTSQNAARYTATTERMTNIVDTLSDQATTQRTMAHRDKDPREKQAVLIDAERRSAWLSESPHQPTYPNICYVHTFNGEVFPIDSRALQPINPSPLGRELHQLELEMNRRASWYLEDCEEETQQLYKDIMRSMLEPKNYLPTNPIEQFVSNFSDPEYFDAWLRMTPQQQINYVELIRQLHYVQNPWENPWNWWLMMQYINRY